MIFKNIEELCNKVHELKQQGKKIVWTNGCFDILHPGHIETFKKAKEYGDILIVGLNADTSPYRKTKPGRPINNEDFRSHMLSAIRFVDFIYVYDTHTPLEAIAALLPDVLLKGGDYKLQDIVGYQEVIANGGQVITVPTVPGYSTTNIVKNVQKKHSK